MGKAMDVIHEDIKESNKNADKAFASKKEKEEKPDGKIIQESMLDVGSDESTWDNGCAVDLVVNTLQDAFKVVIKEGLEELAEKVLANMPSPGPGPAAPAAALLQQPAPGPMPGPGPAPGPAPEAPKFPVAIFVSLFPGRDMDICFESKGYEVTSEITDDTEAGHVVKGWGFESEHSAGSLMQKGAGKQIPKLPSSPTHLKKELKAFHYNVEWSCNSKTTIVEATFAAKPGTGGNEMALIEGILRTSAENDVLHQFLIRALYSVTNVAPKLDDPPDDKYHLEDLREVEKHHPFAMGHDDIKQWSFGQCENHMAKITRLFGNAYTRRQMPVALYNECTNFMVELSFSHDLLVTPEDRMKCRQATVKYSKRWQFAVPPVEKKVDRTTTKYAVKWDFSIDPMIFRDWCHDTCELKYGQGATKCHVRSGDKLIDQFAGPAPGPGPVPR
eukprot:gnl/TRDRNA2_/TRDRNA2_37811_c1_seq1.p1 gnl/TRDRNA2_/TRDRNA2_37811_c1~~gnl/TRDRNA2_/TRDRNA2_37811_c1_seq1.p1  ORF type:complete len:497 (+),score=141.53 gnl/TRDRNA2_/TRDRNA2_37811_c1_seq1:160-1491(+)